MNDVKGIENVTEKRQETEKLDRFFAMYGGQYDKLNQETDIDVLSTHAKRELFKNIIEKI